jgi:hypothetical protein
VISLVSIGSFGKPPSKMSHGNPEQYPFSLPQAPAEFRIELG